VSEEICKVNTPLPFDMTAEQEQILIPTVDSFDNLNAEHKCGSYGGPLGSQVKKT